MRITQKHIRSTHMTAVAVLSFMLGIVVLVAGIFLGKILMNGILLESIGAVFCLFLWLYSIHCLYKAYNITVITENSVRTVRSPFFYMFDGDVTLKRNKNKQLEVYDTLYITHTFGVDGPKIGDTYLILSNSPLEEDYFIHDDQNAIVIISSEEILNALRETFDCHEVDNLRDIVEEKGLYRIVTTPQGEGYKERKWMIRSMENFTGLLFFSVIMSIWMCIAVKIEPISYKTYYLGFLISCLDVTFVVFGCAYIIISQEYITEFYFPCIPIKKIYFSECAEIGMFTAKYTGGRGVSYIDYFYFSPRILSEEERKNIQGLPETDYKKIPYSKKLHTYLTDTLGIELKGKLREKEK